MARIPQCDKLISMIRKQIPIAHAPKLLIRMVLVQIRYPISNFFLFTERHSLFSFEEKLFLAPFGA
ncbi:hypothetical protein P872_05905 [Rhodonellum psychrophilum GCM71 = DSM 17998]|uniref:Uncharacterized protein n=1 Tax=Rhodonellum psychrophilum GCM71 = DSM 17998 TaxID=1123057 RepID=U5BXG1_9BACT|nr:hypothetical protein P872_05905 [Rhodonellum psychrophilum GCM71 = DSM 17998]